MSRLFSDVLRDVRHGEMIDDATGIAVLHGNPRLNSSN